MQRGFLGYLLGLLTAMVIFGIMFYREIIKMFKDIFKNL